MPTGHVTPAPAPESDLQNLSKLRLGVAQYVQDYDQTLPPTNSSSAFQAVLQPYVKNASAFVSPDSGLPYTLNAAISERSITSFSDPSTVVLLQDARRNNDGSLNTLYVDYHVSTQFDLLPTDVLADPAGLSHVFWRDGRDVVALWTVSAAGMPQTEPLVSLTGGTGIGEGFGADGMTRVLWDDGGGAIALETVDAKRYAGPQIPVTARNDGWTPLLTTTSATDSTGRASFGATMTGVTRSGMSPRTAFTSAVSSSTASRPARPQDSPSARTESRVFCGCCRREAPIS